MLEGEADAILPELPAADGGSRHRLRRGQFAYYPAEVPHTLEAVGDRPASYLMLRWLGTPAGSSTPLRAAIHDVGIERSVEAEESPARLVMAGPTGWLGRVQVHLSTRQPGTGYEPHVDAHDVILVTLEGEIETLGKTVGPNHVVLYAAGRPHGLRAAGATAARYVVFEFHGAGAAMVGSASATSAAATVRFAPGSSGGQQPPPLRTAISVLARSAVFWLRNLPRRLGQR